MVEFMALWDLARIYSGRDEKIGTGDRQDPSGREVESKEVWNEWGHGRHQKT